MKVHCKGTRQALAGVSSMWCGVNYEASGLLRDQFQDSSTEKAAVQSRKSQSALGSDSHSHLLVVFSNSMSCKSSFWPCSIIGRSDEVMARQDLVSALNSW